MASEKIDRRRLLYATLSVVIVSLAYIALALLLPINRHIQHQYGLSQLAYRFVEVVLAVPFIITWMTAFYGSTKLRQYADSLGNGKAAKGFKALARGTIWIAWSLPITAALSLALNAYGDRMDHQRLLTILNDYAVVIIPLIGFSVLGLGAHRLLALSRKRLGAGMGQILTAFFVILGVIYCYLVFRTLDLGSLTASIKPYYLPVWLIILTINIPSLYAWFIGLLAVGEISRFSETSYGIVYKKSATYIALGLVAVVLSSIALTYITTVKPGYSQSSFGFLLLASYAIRIIGAIGFIGIAAGAIRLKSIEEI